MLFLSSSPKTLGKSALYILYTSNTHTQMPRLQTARHRTCNAVRWTNTAHTYIYINVYTIQHCVSSFPLSGFWITYIHTARERALVTKIRVASVVVCECALECLDETVRATYVYMDVCAGSLLYTDWCKRQIHTHANYGSCVLTLYVLMRMHSQSKHPSNFFMMRKKHTRRKLHGKIGTRAHIHTHRRERNRARQP